MKKLVKRLGCLLLFVLLCTGGSHVLAQEDPGYVYDKLYVQAEVNDKREVHITETMDIDFTKAMHGIVRTIPQASSVESYRIQDIKVSGMPFTLDYVSNAIDVKIGDANQTVTGKKRITLSYTLRHYQDYDEDNDYLYLNLLGTDYDTEVKDFQADVQFPSPERLHSFKVTSGTYGSTMDYFVNSEQRQNHIYVNSKNAIPARHGVTLQMKFAQGVFAQAPEYPFPYVIKHNNLQVVVDEQQDFHVTQKVSIQVNQSGSINLPFISDSWPRDTYELRDLKISDKDIRKNYDNTLGYYAHNKETKNVTISYTLHPYQLMNTPFQLKLFLEQKDARMDQFSMVMTLPYEAQPSVWLGRNGESQDGRYTLSQDGTTIGLQIDKPLRGGDRFTITIPNHKEAFHREVGMLVKIGMIGSVGLVLVLAILRFMIYRRKDLITPISFYPPQGMNPADAGYVIDLKLSDSDMTALLYYWADQGYMKIQDRDGSFVLEKLQDPSSNAPVYERKLFQAMFAHGAHNYVMKENLEDVFYADIREAKQTLMRRYQKDTALSDPSIEHLRTMMLLLSILPMLLMSFLSYYEVYGNMTRTLLQMLPLSPMLIMLLPCLLMYRRSSHGTMPKSSSVIVGTIFGIFILVNSITTFFLMEGAALYVLAGTGASILAWLLANGIRKDSDYRLSLLSQLLGFKEFLKTAEKDRLETLLEEDPEYFYHILPYAQVLHVSDIWEKKFQDITMPPPSWYDSRDVYSYTHFHTFMHTMNRDMRKASTPPASSGSGRSSSGGGYSGGGGSYSGGGFSGGGSGGGGSHGW